MAKVIRLYRPKAILYEAVGCFLKERPDFYDNVNIEEFVKEIMRRTSGLLNPETVVGVYKELMADAGIDYLENIVY